MKTETDVCCRLDSEENQFWDRIPRQDAIRASASEKRPRERRLIIKQGWAARQAQGARNSA